MSSVRRTVLILLWIALLAAPASPAAAQMIRKDGELVLHAFTLRHRSAMEALQLVSSLLTKRGTIELQPATNTLVIRDTPAALGQIIPALQRYDRASRPLSLDVYIVRATRTTISGAPVQSDLPEPLTARLRALLPYDNFYGQAQARLSSREGEAVTYTLGGEYEVSFRLGTIVQKKVRMPDLSTVIQNQVRLTDFRIARVSELRRTGTSLFEATLILPLEQTTSFVLARHEGSHEALMVVLNLREIAKQRPAQQPRR